MIKNVARPISSLKHDNLNPFRLIAFSGPAAPLAMLLVPIGAYLPTFYATEVGISLSWVGLAFMLARLWDGITDPLIGRLSDATRCRFGKRRIWIFCGLVPLMLCIYFLFNAPADSGKAYLIIWMTLFYFSWTVVQVPYLSWGAKLSTDYTGRSRVFGFRETGTTFGVLLSAALPLFLLGADATMGDILKLLSQAILILLPLTVFIALFFVGETERSIAPSRCKSSLLTALKTNRPYLRFLVFILVFYIGITLAGVVSILFLQYRLQLPDAVTTMIFTLYVMTVISVFFFVKLARHIGRHKVLGISAIGFVISYLLLGILPSKSYGLTLVCFGLLGFFNAAFMPMCPAVIGDLSDFGKLKGYGEQMGSYMAGYNLVMKLGVAIGIGVGFPLLQFMGFDAATGVNEGNSKALMMVGSIFPALIIFPCVLIIWNFPIDARRHTIIRRWLASARP